MAWRKRSPCRWSYFTSQTRSMRSGSHDRSLPALQRLCPPGMRETRRPRWPTRATDDSSSAPFLSGASSSTSCLRFSIVNADVTPTCCSFPRSSYNPSRSEPTASFPLLCHRKPATTQSAGHPAAGGRRVRLQLVVHPGRGGSDPPVRIGLRRQRVTRAETDQRGDRLLDVLRLDVVQHVTDVLGDVVAIAAFRRVRARL